jgi:hypothetical protein
MINVLFDPIIATARPGTASGVVAIVLLPRHRDILLQAAAVR